MKRFRLLEAYQVGPYKLEEVAPKVHNIPERFRGVGNYPPEWNQTGMRSSDLRECLDFATLTHLGYYDPHPDVSYYCREAVKVAIDYFYGNYPKEAEGMERSPSNDGLSWAGVYRDGVFFALLMQDYIATKRLSEWIAQWFPYNESEYNFKREDNYYHMILAAWLGEQGEATDELETNILKSRFKRSKLLLSTLLTIKDGDSDSFGVRLGEYLKYYMKSELTGEFITSWFSIEASILWHVAKRENLVLPELEEKPAALIMTQETLGIAE